MAEAALASLPPLSLSSRRQWQSSTWMKALPTMCRRALRAVAPCPPTTTAQWLRAPLLFLLALLLLSSPRLCSGQSSVATLVTPLTTTSTCVVPFDVDYDDTARIAYTACYSSGGVLGTAFSGVTTQYASATQCSNPSGVAKHVASGILYATCLDAASGANSRVLSITTSGVITVVASAAQCTSPYGVAVNQVTGVAYVACFNGYVIAITPSATPTIAALTTFAQCANPFGLYLEATSGVLYVACLNSGTIAIRLSDGNVKQLVSSASCVPYRVVASSQAVYISCATNLISVDLAGTATSIKEVATVSQCSAPYGLTITRSGHVVAACNSGAIVALIGSDASSGVLALVSSTQCPNPIAVQETINGAYVAACTGGTTLYFSAIIVTSLIRTDADECRSLTIDTDTGDMLASCDDGGLKHIIGGQLTQITTSAQCAKAEGAQRDTVTGIIYVACFNQGVIAILPSDGRNMTLVTPTQCPGATDLLLDRVKQRLYIACNTGAVLVLSTTNYAISQLASSTQCPNPISLALNNVTGVLYVACVGGGVVSISSSTSTVTQLATSAQCPQASSVAVNIRTNMLYVACYTGGSQSRGEVNAINGTSGVIIRMADASICSGPTSLALDIATGIMFAACRITGVAAFFPDGEVQILPESSQCSVASGVFLNPTTKHLYVLCSGGGLVDIARDLTCSAGFEMTASQIGCARCESGLARNYTMALQTQAQGPMSAAATASRQCTPCASGWVAPQTAAANCRPCAAATFSYSAAVECMTCDAGTWSGLATSGSCTRCDGGSYGSSPGTATNSSCSGKCSPGYWCAPGSTSSKQRECGARSLYCPEGAASQSEVGFGYWATGSSDGTVKTMTARMPCAKGSYCDGSGLSRQCSPGTFQNQTMQVDCLSCTPGTYSDAGASKCEPCPSGSTSPAGSSYSSCTACAPGTMATSSNLCVECPVSTYSLAGATTCTPCPPGQITNTPGSSYCSACKPGQTNGTDLITGKATCENCLAGSASQGGSACQPCAIGSYSPTNASIFCLPCPAGSFTSSTGQSSCTSCSPGSYSLLPSSSECLPCDPGSYASDGDATSCTLCPQGTSSNATGSYEACTPCDPGQYQGAVGSTTCFKCDPRFTSNSSAAVCYQPSCNHGQQYDSEALQCQACDLGQFSAGGSGAQCNACSVNSYTPYAGADCISCTRPGMDGLSCSGGLASVKEGYWAQLVYDPELSVETFQTFTCPPQFCPGAVLQEVSASGNASTGGSSSHVALQPLSQCVSPRSNDGGEAVLCGGCIDGYVAWNGNCVSCTRVNGGLVFLSILLSFALVLFLLRSGGSSESAGFTVILLYFVQTAMLQIGNASNFLSWMRVFNFGSSTFSACLGPMTPYEQVQLSIFTPLILLGELLLVSLVHLALHRWVSRGLWNTEAGPDVDEAAWVASPVAAAASASAAAAPPLSRTMRVLRFVASKFSWSKYVGGCVSILLFCYTQVATSCIQYLNCTSVGPRSVVFLLPSLDCDSSVYKANRGSVLFVLLVYIVGFPVFIFAFLLHRRSKLRGMDPEDVARAVAAKEQAKEFPSSPSSAANSRRTSIATPTQLSRQASPAPGVAAAVGSGSGSGAGAVIGASIHSASFGSSLSFVARWGPLFEMYGVHAWFWQVSVLLRRGAFVAVSVTLVQTPHIRCMAFAFLNFGALVTQQLVHPFGSKLLNQLESAAHAMLLAISICMIPYSPPYSTALQIGLFFLIVPLLCTLFLLVIRTHAINIHRKIIRSPGVTRHPSMALAKGAPGPALPLAAAASSTGAAAASPRAPAQLEMISCEI